MTISIMNSILFGKPAEAVDTDKEALRRQEMQVGDTQQEPIPNAVLAADRLADSLDEGGDIDLDLLEEDEISLILDHAVEMGHMTLGEDGRYRLTDLGILAMEKSEP